MPAKTGSHTRQAAAHKAAQVHHANERSNNRSSRGQHSMSRSEAGRKGAEARWGRRAGEEKSHTSSHSHSKAAAHLSRAEAGRRGAEVRWGKREGAVTRHKTTQSHPVAGHMSRSEAGKRGAEARWGYRLDENGAREARKSSQRAGHMSRSEAGRKGAEARWGHRIEEREEPAPARSRQMRGARSEMSRRGAEVRRGRENSERMDKRRLGRYPQERALARESTPQRSPRGPWRQNFEDEDEFFLEQNARLVRPYEPERAQSTKKQPKSTWRWVQVFDLDEEDEEEEDNFLSRQRAFNRLSHQRSRSPWERDYDLEIDYLEDEDQY